MPPRQFYGKAIRKSHNPNLLTLRVHKRCNQQYQHDEDYFVNTFIPLAHDTYTGNSVLRDNLEKYRNRQQVGLMQKVLREFDSRPSGLILPHGKVAKRLEGQRVHRIAWKIVRGLYFYHEGKVLPEATSRNLQIVSPGERPPDVFFALDKSPNLGIYPGVFDHRYAQFPEVHNMYFWAMLLWDRLILLMAFHDPSEDRMPGKDNDREACMHT